MFRDKPARYTFEEGDRFVLTIKIGEDVFVSTGQVAAFSENVFTLRYVSGSGSSAASSEFRVEVSTEGRRIEGIPPAIPITSGGGGGTTVAVTSVSLSPATLSLTVGFYGNAYRYCSAQQCHKQSRNMEQQYRCGYR